jgi:hypothetical protein
VASQGVRESLPQPITHPLRICACSIVISRTVNPGCRSIPRGALPICSNLSTVFVISRAHKRSPTLSRFLYLGFSTPMTSLRCVTGTYIFYFFNFASRNEKLSFGIPTLILRQKLTHARHGHRQSFVCEKPYPFAEGHAAASAKFLP